MQTQSNWLKSGLILILADMRAKSIAAVLAISIFCTLSFGFSEEVNIVPEVQSITISFAGDCTLGQDAKSKHGNSFSNVYQRVKDPKYFLSKVADIFSKDDLTVVNLETTLTHATVPRAVVVKAPVKSLNAECIVKDPKQVKPLRSFRFKGLPAYRQILTSGFVDVVNLANNHSKDYMTKGNLDTKKYLKSSGIAYVEENETVIKTVHGVKVGILGLRGFDLSPSTLKRVQLGVKSLKDQQCAVIIAVFHWGEKEQVYKPDKIQVTLGKVAVAAGADLVVGSHAHVLQGIDTYHGKTIVYGLGNFCFGGNVRPKDFDTMIYQHTFNLVDNKIVGESSKVIPCSISSVKGINNFQPMLLVGKEKERVLQKIASLGPSQNHYISRNGDILFKEAVAAAPVVVESQK